jgi:hypothetical protein
MTAITQERMESALDYLATTDDAFADAKAQLARCEILAKRARARIILTSEGSVEVKKATAETHPEVGQADDELIEAITVYERLRAKRDRAEVVIDVFRTLEASRRRA